ncbi:MAG: TetR/AcrR family transcriptional regulator [Pseudomonadota bacterium]
MLSPKERILTTAHTLFYKNGFRATGVNQLISEAGVTKVTFYRHYSSKESLIRAFLKYRHERWISWFRETLNKNGRHRDAIVPTLGEWFNSADFRGCAFINALSELEGQLRDIREIVGLHKQEVVDAIATCLPPSRTRRKDAAAIAIAVDGAIVRAQYDNSPRQALSALKAVISLIANK